MKPTAHASGKCSEKLAQPQSLRRIYTSDDSSYYPRFPASKSMKEGLSERSPSKTPKFSVILHEGEVPVDLFFWGEDHSLLPRSLKSTRSLNARKIFCGDQCASLVNERGEVFTWGKDRSGRLGHKTNEDVTHPKLVHSLVNETVHSIAFGARHACALTTCGQILAWGDDQRDSRKSPWLPRRLHLPLLGVSITKIACGDWHTALVSSSGQLFTFGDGAFGVLGHGDLKSFSEPKEVEAMRGTRVKTIACGLWHSAAIVELGGELSEGKLFTWGDNDEGKLGHPWREKTLVPKMVAALEDQSFLQVSCGVTMTVALTIKGKVFAMGNSSILKVGGALEGEFVKQISAGSSHVAVLTLKGEVYTWGKGANGRLGHGDVEDRDFPARVEALRERQVCSVACGSSFTAAVCFREAVNDRMECSGCRLGLGFTRKKHVCCGCGQVFCHSCIRRKVAKKQFRFCEACFESSGLEVREAASPRLTLFLKKGLSVLKNDVKKIADPVNPGRPMRDRRWGQVPCPALFGEFQTKGRDEFKISLPTVNLKAEFKKPERSLLEELEQLRRESAQINPDGGVKSLGYLLYDKISRIPEKSLKGARKDPMDRISTLESPSGTKKRADRSRHAGSSEKNEWVEEDDPGVYVTFVILPGGRKCLERVRFSRRLFSQKEAEKWWNENQIRVRLKYHHDEHLDYGMVGGERSGGLGKLN